MRVLTTLSRYGGSQYAQARTGDRRHLRAPASRRRSRCGRRRQGAPAPSRRGGGPGGADWRRYTIHKLTPLDRTIELSGARLCGYDLVHPSRRRWPLPVACLWVPEKSEQLFPEILIKSACW